MRCYAWQGGQMPVAFLCEQDDEARLAWARFPRGGRGGGGKGGRGVYEAVVSYSVISGKGQGWVISFK